MVNTYNGIGIYMRQLKPDLATAKRCAKLAADNGVNFVALLAAWFDIEGGKQRNLRVNTPDTIAMYAAEMENQGVITWLWGYPRADAIPEFAENLAKAAKHCGGIVSGYILDPEVYFKGKKGKGKLLMDQMRLRTKLPIGMTSYGMAKGHKTFPWSEFTMADFGSPQMYEVEPADVHAGLAAWDWFGYKTLVPSVPAFGRKSGAALNDYLGCFVDSLIQVHGFIVWSWPQISPDEWRVLARWADWFSRYEDLGKR